MASQVSVFLENKIGHLQKVTAVLRKEGINIRAMTLTHSMHGWGILNLIVNKPVVARDILVENSISAVLREIVVIEMDDHPGGLDDLLLKISDAGVNFINAYGRMVEPGKTAYLIIDVEDLENALKKLSAAGLRIVNDDTIYGNGK